MQAAHQMGEFLVEISKIELPDDQHIYLRFK